MDLHRHARASCRGPTRRSPRSARKQFGGDLAGRVTLTAGLGGMGGAQPLAVTMAGGVAICVEVRPVADRPADRARLPRRRGRRRRRRAAPGCGGPRQRAPAVDRPARQRRRRGAAAAGDGRADRVVTDQTSAHDPLAYMPAGSPSRTGGTAPGPSRRSYHPGAGVDGPPRRGDGRFRRRRGGGLRLRQLDPGRGQAGRLRAGVRLPWFRAGLHPAAVLRGQGPVPVGGAVRAIRPTSPRPTAPCSICSRRTNHCTRWLRMAAEKVHFQGLPARICWLGYGERNRAGVRFNELVASGEVRRRSSSGATTWTAGRSPRRTGRPRRWRTARMRSRTGRCSTPW